MQTISLPGTLSFLFYFFFLMDNSIKPQGWEGPLCAFFPNSIMYRKALWTKKETERSNFMEIFHGLGCGLRCLICIVLFNLPEILLPPW